MVSKVNKIKRIKKPEMGLYLKQGIKNSNAKINWLNR